MSIILQTILLATLIRQAHTFDSLPVLKSLQRSMDNIISNYNWQQYIFQYGEGYEDLWDLIEDNPQSHVDVINSLTPVKIQSLGRQFGYSQELSIREIKQLLTEDVTYRWLLMLDTVLINPVIMKGFVDTLIDAIIIALQISVPTLLNKRAYLIDNLPSYRHIVDNGIQSDSSLDLDPDNIYQTFYNCTDLQIYHILCVQDISHHSRDSLLKRAYDLDTGNGDAYIVEGNWINYIYQRNKYPIDSEEIYGALEVLATSYVTPDVNVSQIYYGLNLTQLSVNYSSVLPGGQEWNKAMKLAIENETIHREEDFIKLLNY